MRAESLRLVARHQYLCSKQVGPLASAVRAIIRLFEEWLIEKRPLFAGHLGFPIVTLFAGIGHLENYRFDPGFPLKSHGFLYYMLEDSHRLETAIPGGVHSGSTK